MSENLPDSFDPEQPDLPTLAVDPDPDTEERDGTVPTREPLKDDAGS